MIRRDDMMELTRRMTPSRNCFSRIAGAYMDPEGYDNGTFNTHFGNLKSAETKRNLEIAKAIPFAKENEELVEYRFSDSTKKNSMWQLLMGLRKAELKDDALLSILYEVFGESYKTEGEYSIYVYYGAYDVPVKGTDKEWIEGSEEVYSFLVCVVSPLKDEYEPGNPEFGFLFPAFYKRSSDENGIYIFSAKGSTSQKELIGRIIGC
ncbi:MAG: DUF4317 family protein [Lachnospiraceae bacterium]|nr:DUF4317 family protein [Lachnospiraceae bacterium]